MTNPPTISPPPVSALIAEPDKTYRPGAVTAPWLGWFNELRLGVFTIQNGVADGDKGDITVSVGGTVWTIDPAAVTLAKMANLPTGRVIGRTSAGTGVPEALPTVGTGSVVLSAAPYTDGQLLIGDTAGNTLGKSTLTAGNAIAITNGASAITIAAAPSSTTTKYYGAFSDYTNQPLVSTTVGQVMTFNTTDLGSHGVSLATTSRMKVANDGIYNFQWSGQFRCTSASLQDAYVWIRINGTDVVGSTGLISVPNKHAGDDGHTIAAWNYMLNLNANDYVELVWGGSSTALSIATYAAGASPTRPSTASLIATFQQV